MSDEISTMEAADRAAQRPVMIRKRCSTTTDHQPGDIIMFAGELYKGGVMRELTDEELDERARIERIEQANREAEDAATQASMFSKENRESVRDEIIREAIAQLDPMDDAHWTETGQPTIGALNGVLLKMGATPETTSRAEVRAIAPDALRPRPEMAPAQGGGEVI